jgi:arylsulfatase
MRKSPHVILIMCDQLRADALGFMGNDIVQTPNLDRLAGQGTVFDSMYVQTPVCMGSRACIMTGRYLRTLRMGGGAPILDPREVTMPEILQRQGYSTAMFGKLHLTPQQYTLEALKSDSSVTDATPFTKDAGIPAIPDDPVKRNYGFQHVTGHEDALWGEYREWLARRDPDLAALLPDIGMSSWEGWNTYPDFPEVLGDVGPTCLRAEVHPSMFIGTSAAQFFTENHRKSPCFMHVSFVDPHHPWDPPAEVLKKYDWNNMPLPAYSDTEGITWPKSMEEKRPDFGKVSPEQTRKTVACYYAMIDMVDQSVGKLVDAVETAGEMDSTIFMFIADHGEFLGSYGLFRKGAHHYDCLIRVPAFITWTGGGIAPGQRQSGLVEEIDLLPTLLGLLRTESDSGIQGIDMSQALLDGGKVGRPWVYCESYFAPSGPYVDCWTLRTENAKLNFYPRDRLGHLFDLKSDPDERVDLFHSEEHRELRDEMTANLLECIHSQTDPIPRMISQY